MTIIKDVFERENQCLPWPDLMILPENHKLSIRCITNRLTPRNTGCPMDDNRNWGIHRHSYTGGDESRDRTSRLNFSAQHSLDLVYLAT